MAALNGWDRAEFTEAAGTRMHAAVRGPPDAPVVVCVHGLGCSHRYGDEMFELEPCHDDESIVDIDSVDPPLRATMRALLAEVNGIRRTPPVRPTWFWSRDNPPGSRP